MSDLPTPNYAEEMNSKYEHLRSLALATVGVAIELGQMLIAQKKRTKHGDFMTWVKDHCAFSHESANIYMRIAADPNSQHATNLSLREFLEKPNIPPAVAIAPMTKQDVPVVEKQKKPDTKPAQTAKNAKTKHSTPPSTKTENGKPPSKGEPDNVDDVADPATAGNRLRFAWDGFNAVSDEELDTAIAAYNWATTTFNFMSSIGVAIVARCLSKQERGVLINKLSHIRPLLDELETHLKDDAIIVKSSDSDDEAEAQPPKRNPPKKIH